ncbi:MAG: 2-oxoglutarate dehydrogenase E1 component [Deltaproteobacteria bacterium]|nr:2-oxoglutarate dehydrogenase E1 component [Deltaproteobacteria bacterium]
MGNPVTNLDFISRANAEYVDALYEQFQRDPASVDASWALFFAGFEAARGNGARPAAVAPAAVARTAVDGERHIGVFDLIHSYRELGHLVANLDPLGHNQTAHPLLEPSEFGFTEADLDRVLSCPILKGCSQAPLREIIERLRATYCGTLGVEYMDIPVKEQRAWLQERMEPLLNRPALSPEQRQHVLSLLTSAEGFEQYLHTKYVGQKRFSLEGGDVLIPMLDAMVEECSAQGVGEIVMGMAHRGRLNVLAHTFRKPYEMIFTEFEGTRLPQHITGDGDVKYHLGYSREYTTRFGRNIHLSMCSNPSHLEAIDPVVEGLVRAKQHRLGDEARGAVVPVLIHGDAAFTGQGLVAETLALSELQEFRTGGTIHIIINNQIGFTAEPSDYRFTRYPSDIAKIIQAPVFHVNGDDPEAAVHAARLAAAFRAAFKVDVIIDLICYRRYGHNETDDPTSTQPLMYKEIAAHPSVRKLYAERLIAEGVTTQEEIDKKASALRELFDDALNYARDFMPRQQVFALGGLWKGMRWAGDDWSAQTAVPAGRLHQVVDGVLRLPQGFAVHPKVHKLLVQRREMVRQGAEIDWGGGEMLAFGTLLLEGTHVRLSGQDSGRGTFSHRHSVLRDVDTNQRYVPLDHVAPDQARFTVIDSMLSEAAVLGFEYGFAAADPTNLVIWEAQFGDFANGAQVIIDQFISSAESKWQKMNGLVMLLPHGYEGQGPEHSSARLERYLQLCAENNLQVCNLTTPAQYFHALRRQMHRNFRKPLIVMSPKSLLRDIDDIAIARVEQLYPFPDKGIEQVLQLYGNAREVMWVQEEPWNMGAWHEMHRRLTRLVGETHAVTYSGRRASASPATGSYKAHKTEEADLINNALRRSYAR